MVFANLTGLSNDFIALSKKDPIVPCTGHCLNLVADSSAALIWSSLTTSGVLHIEHSSMACISTYDTCERSIDGWLDGDPSSTALPTPPRRVTTGHIDSEVSRILGASSQELPTPRFSSELNSLKDDMVSIKATLQELMLSQSRFNADIMEKVDALVIGMGANPISANRIAAHANTGTATKNVVTDTIVALLHVLWNNEKSALDFPMEDAKLRKIIQCLPNNMVHVNVRSNMAKRLALALSPACTNKEIMFDVLKGTDMDVMTFNEGLKACMKLVVERLCVIIEPSLVKCCSRFQGIDTEGKICLGKVDTAKAFCMGKVTHVPMNGSYWKAIQSITITGTHTPTHAISLCAAIVGGFVAIDGTYNKEESLRKTKASKADIMTGTTDEVLQMSRYGVSLKNHLPEEDPLAPENQPGILKAKRLVFNPATTKVLRQFVN